MLWVAYARHLCLSVGSFLCFPLTRIFEGIFSPNAHIHTNDIRRGLLKLIFFHFVQYGRKASIHPTVILFIVFLNKIGVTVKIDHAIWNSVCYRTSKRILRVHTVHVNWITKNVESAISCGSQNKMELGKCLHCFIL